MDFGRCFCISSTVSPGHPIKLPCLMALVKVDGTGQKLHAWFCFNILDDGVCHMFPRVVCEFTGFPCI